MKRNFGTIHTHFLKCLISLIIITAFFITPLQATYVSAESSFKRTDINEVVTSKTVLYDEASQNYKLHLESYVTGTDGSVSQVPIPSDIVLVLDESGSMDDCIHCGHEMNNECSSLEHNGTTVTRGHWVVAEGVNTSKTYKVIFGDGSERILSYCKTCENWYSSSNHNDHKPAGGGLYEWTPFKGISNEAFDYNPSDGDGYHVKFYCNCGSNHNTTQTRNAILKSAVNSFLTAVYADSVGDINDSTDNIDNRIAIVGYDNDEPSRIYTVNGTGNTKATEANCANAFKSAITQQSIINTAVNSIIVGGPTATNRGMEAAELILAKNPIPTNEERNRVVILFTDGSPGSGYVNDPNWANGAIKAAYNAKNKYNATVYSIGLFFGADNSNPGNLPIYDKNQNGVNNAQFFANGNRFLHLVSSNYKSAQSLDNTGTVTDLGESVGYYLSTDNKEGLMDIFGQLSSVVKPGEATIELDEKTIVRDVVNPNFKITNASNVVAWTESYKGTVDGKMQWEKDSGTDSTENSGVLKVDVNSDTVTITNFDFSENYVSINKDENGNDVPHGKKIVLEIPISVAKSNFGGIHQDTNILKDSAILYPVNNETNEVIEHFELPHVDVPTTVNVAKVVTGHGADLEENFYFTTEYTEHTGYRDIDDTTENASNYLRSIVGTATTEKTLQGENGKNSFSISNVIVGSSLTISEKDIPAGYVLDSVKVGDAFYTPVNGKVTIDAVTPNMNIVFTNRLTTTNVTVEKQVTGNMGDVKKDFTFEATLTMDGKDLAFPEPIQGDTSYTTNGNVATFDLKDDEKVTLNGIPYGAKLKITETNFDGYEVSISKDGNDVGENGTVTINNVADSSVVYTNHRTVDIDTGIDNFINSNRFLLSFTVLAIAVMGEIALVKFYRRKRVN